MHLAGKPPRPPRSITDSMRMFQWGVERGRPAEGEVGIAPEWFYKGDGSVLRGPFEPLAIPPYAEDGGEEAELAGIYLIAPDGTPHRIGFAHGNEFSDHKFEKRNYLNLAGSKLRACSLGPELVVGADFSAVTRPRQHPSAARRSSGRRTSTAARPTCATASPTSSTTTSSSKATASPAPSTSTSSARTPSASAMGSNCENGDIVEVSFNGFGRPLRNPIHRDDPHPTSSSA